MLYRGVHTCGVDREVSAAGEAAPPVGPQGDRQITLDFESGHAVKNDESDGGDFSGPSFPATNMVDGVDPEVPAFGMVNDQFFSDDFDLDVLNFYSFDRC